MISAGCKDRVNGVYVCTSEFQACPPQYFARARTYCVLNHITAASAAWAPTHATFAMRVERLMEPAKVFPATSILLGNMLAGDSSWLLRQGFVLARWLQACLPGQGTAGPELELEGK